MAKWLVAFASMTGNTEEIAELIAEGITQSGHEVDLKSVTDCNAADVLDYDGFMIGVYTWGDGELPDEFLDFYEELDELDLSGRRAAVFGSGDTSYEQFCKAVDLTAEKLQERGAEVSPETLKIEYSPLEQEKETCRDFGKRFVAAGEKVS
ncbi:flavodoxin [Paenibacillus silvae]|jgi:flavodoxin I|uniref:Flavodoxin n=1 Tax=Paenibacillus silvae TaxID=1325358 RepID=A0A2W6NFD1_9BACL|nr:MULTISPECIES: flavodoxin [Paenibacillus]MBU5352315.1 flavodoxin [Paenibacillus barcinonensis]MDM5276965.1 flavodoxin [Paenibacillus silvae]PZT54439.1 flavodoxin [Paenibacillus silvae]